MPTNIKGSNNNTCLPIQIAVGGEDIDLLNFLLQSGADPNTCYPNYVSVLMHAAFQKCTKAVETLLAFEANPTCQNIKDLTARDYADPNSSDIKQLLLCEKQKIA